MKKLFVTLLAMIMALSAVSASAIDFTDLFGGEEADVATDSEAQETTVDDYQDIELSSKKDNGLIRVYLKSLNLPISLTLVLDGVYTVGNDSGRRFDRGTRIVLSDGEDRIYMTVGGFTMDMGDKVQLIRHASGDEENGIRIAETQRSNIYPGDLTVTRESAGGGLKAILTVGVEDYLHGVIAYEMSDSWPIEALKSQAVAARTYAMQRKAAAGSKEYDLVDTTADQVYRGTDISLLNVDAAVKATTGVVATYKGNYVTCYYTASNGGEIALPSDVWSSTGDFGYLGRAEDPYDLENPNSVVKTLSFSTDCEECPELKELIEEKLTDQIGAEAENVCLDTILAVELANPEPEESKMYRTLRFTVSAGKMVTKYVPSDTDIGAPADATEVLPADMALAGIDILRRILNDSGYESEDVFEEIDGTFTVDLDIYEQIKPLGLAINSLDCELFTVEGGQFGYTISARRFGHGVGMSQRGAQRMAGTYEKTWRDIISFYYPGVKIERVEWESPVLETLAPLPTNVGAANQVPTTIASPAELPALAEGERYAVVKLDDSSSTLNMRVMPTTDSRIIALLTAGQRLIVSGEKDANGWVSVHTAEFSGYVKAEYLTYE